MLLKNRRLFLLFLPVLFFSLIVFHRPLICVVLKQVFARQMSYLKSTQLSYGHLGYNDGAIYLDHISLVDPVLQQELLHIDKVECHFLLKWNIQKWSTSYKVIKPSMTWHQASHHSALHEFDLYHILSIPHIAKKVTIEEGEILCNTSQGSLLMHLSFLPGIECTHMGLIQLRIDQENRRCGHLTLDVYKNIKDLFVQMRVDQMPLSIVTPLVSAVHGMYVEGGILNGEVQLGVTSDRKLHSLKADLALTEVSVIDQHDVSFFEVEECRVRAMLPLGNQNKIDVTHLSLPMFMRYIVFTCELEGGTICFNNPKTHSVWHFSDIEAMFTCNLAHTPSVSIKGQLERDSLFYPFDLQGKGVIESDQNWWMDVELCGAERGHPKTSHIPFYIALLDGKEYFIKASVQQLGTQALQMAQDLALIWFPALNQFQIMKGSLTTEMIVRIQDKKIQTLSLESLACTSIEGVWHNQKFHCGDLHGKVKLHFPIFTNIKAPLWEIAFEDLKVEDHKGELFLQSAGSISSKDWKIGPSWITTKFDGIEGKWNLSGPYSELELSGAYCLHPKHLASGLQDEVFKVSEHLQRLEKIDCSLKIKYRKHNFNVLGVSNLRYAGAIIDQLRFGMEVSAEQIRQGVCFNQGWFQSDKLSEHTYLWFIKYYKQRWHALGEMKVTGEFNRSAIHFSVESHAAVYDSEDILVNMEATDHLHTGDFIFDLEKKSWFIHLPIRSAVCIDKKFKLPFKEVQANVTIEGLHLAAEDIQATCERVDFCGRLDLDFKNPEWIDLKLYPTTMSGEMQDFLRFLHYLPDFAQLQLPLEGRVEGAVDNYLFTEYNLTESRKTSKISLKVNQGIYVLNKAASLRDISFDLAWDSSINSLEIRGLEGELLLEKDQESQKYHFNAQNLMGKNLSEGEWDFDVRLEAPTLDVVRITGTTEKQGEDYIVHLEPHLTHFFGVKLDRIELMLNNLFEIKTLNLAAKIASNKLIQQLHGSYLGGILDMQPELFHELHALKTEGDIALNVAYARDEQKMVIEMASEELFLDQVVMQDFSTRVVHHEGAWELEYLKTKEIAMHGHANKAGERWEISEFTAQWKNSSIRLMRGSYIAGHLEIELEQLIAHLGELQERYPTHYLDKRLLGGEIHAKGRLIAECSSGIKSAQFLTELIVYSDAVGEEELQITSKIPFKLSYSYQEGVQIEHLNIDVHKKDCHEVWAFSEIKHLQMYLQEGSFIGKGIKMTIPPEMIRYLVQLHLIPHIEVQGNHFIFFESAFKWDNQIETEFDVVYDSHHMQVHGVAKEGYYWVGDKSVYFEHIHYFLDQDQLNLAFGWDYQDVSLDFLTKIQFKEGIEASQEGIEVKVTIKEGHAEERDERKALDVVCRYSNEDGFFFQSIEGNLYGVDFSFRRNPRAYFPDVIILTGQMKVDTAGLVKAFPTLFYQTVKDLGMGRGYELSGDWVFSTKNLYSSYFKGFLKGRDFEFLGFSFKTLLSEVEITHRGVAIHDFRLSDVSGVAQIKEAYVRKSEEDGSWQLEIPEIMVQDFRPSFLKKHDGTEERIKPFVIKDLQFFNIRGTLGYKESFSGEGHLDFINTFKRETNLLDIPIEIIGRIGFDLGLLVPVIGKIEFEMTEGKIFLKELNSTYSEGKRSKFYLSGYKDSYIGLDGTVYVDIKMKQYVLLKITQPFTLSIRGTLIKPKYSLR